MVALWMYTVGPQLFAKFKQDNQTGFFYKENNVEAVSSRLLACLRASVTVCCWISPILLVVMYQRGVFHSQDSLQFLFKFCISLSTIYCAAKLTRGMGRMVNPTYTTFITQLTAFQKGNLTEETIRRYDFEFYAWPVSYSLKTSRSKNVRVSQPIRGSCLQKARLLPCQILSYILSGTLARWMIYPGSTALINALVGPALLDGRVKLVESHNGKRHKLETIEGNHIDTMFIDRRNTGTEVGSVLVIASEGNAAFYEMGCMSAPLESGYSILGWNHPGFGSSTGKPYPEQEQHAVDSVVQFALNKLGFSIEQIVFYSWSIGGYASTWAAVNYPECKGLILDATFDDILPLAKSRMPVYLEPMVEMTVKEYFNLNIGDLLSKYRGPVKLIRRTEDEMISITPGHIRTNRGNHLLRKLLHQRYPQIVNEETFGLLEQWLAVKDSDRLEFRIAHPVDSMHCCKLLESWIAEEDRCGAILTSGTDTEKQNGDQLAIYLADMHMADFESTHCVPLPAAYFKMPWSLNNLL